MDSKGEKDMCKVQGAGGLRGGGWGGLRWASGARTLSWGAGEQREGQDQLWVWKEFLGVV